MVPVQWYIIMLEPPGKWVGGLFPHYWLYKFPIKYLLVLVNPPCNEYWLLYTQSFDQVRNHLPAASWESKCHDRSWWTNRPRTLDAICTGISWGFGANGGSFAWCFQHVSNMFYSAPVWAVNQGVRVLVAIESGFRVCWRINRGSWWTKDGQSLCFNGIPTPHELKHPANWHYQNWAENIQFVSA